MGDVLSVVTQATRTWCHGVVGVKHDLHCVPYSARHGIDVDVSAGWRELVCRVCDKRLALFIPTKFGEPDVKPAWVTS